MIVKDRRLTLVPGQPCGCVPEKCEYMVQHETKVNYLGISELAMKSRLET